jgi:5-methyltetrahydropteroyltriglutamate--homocysteine methyltransferase
VIKFRISIVGSYPKPIYLGKVISRFRSNKLSKDKFENYLKNETLKFFQLVDSVNADYTTDGMFRWDDIVDITFSYLSGAEKGDLMRFYDNNFYYRRPVIKSKLSVKMEYINYLSISKNLLTESKINTKFKAIFLGPLSYLRFSENNYYKDEKELLDDYATETNKAIREAQTIADAIEVHEPSIFDKGIKKDLLEYIPKVYDRLLEGIKIEKHLITYFNINTKRLNILFNLPVDVIGLDIIENKNKVGNIYKNFKDKKIFLGVLNTRNTKLERPSSIIRFVKNAYDKGAKDVLIGNASLMDFIPEIIAKRKIKLLGKVRSTYYG